MSRPVTIHFHFGGGDSPTTSLEGATSATDAGLPTPTDLSADAGVFGPGLAEDPDSLPEPGDAGDAAQEDALPAPVLDEGRTDFTKIEALPAPDALELVDDPAVPQPSSAPAAGLDDLPRPEDDAGEETDPEGGDSC